MRLLFDTNVLIASIISHGSCFEILEHCIRNHTLITSDYIIDEFKRTLLNKFNFSSKDVLEAESIVFERFIKVAPQNIDNIDLSDKSDLPIIGTAAAGKCRLLITGDKELLSIGKYGFTNIVSPTAFWKFERKLNI
ncbi:MAG: putative toxin-antitoxin system toxin component, PIN family [Spirochaetes bacterium]|nr:putative toxin-antitoxin system toxin component, PIN family [Spirochaetota bacterium]